MLKQILSSLTLLVRPASGLRLNVQQSRKKLRTVSSDISHWFMLALRAAGLRADPVRRVSVLNLLT